MNEKLIKGFKILLALTLILGFIMTVRQTVDYKRGEADYDEAVQIANLPTETEISSLASSTKEELSAYTVEDSYAAMLQQNIDLSELQEVNSDVLGWIDIPGTELSYPILQGEDNDYYLNHTWKREANSVGSIFLECQTDPALTDFNTIIYGHRMRDLSMFGSLKYYKDIDYWDENPSVYVFIDGECYKYDIYAAYKAAPTDIIYGLKINSRPKKQELIQFGLEHSVIDTNIIPSTYDRILTLSTCTGNGHASRWVVQAVCPVKTSSIPDNTSVFFEGTDDAPEIYALPLGDSLPSSELSDSGVEESSNSILQTVLLTGFYVCLLLLLTVLIAAALMHYRNVKP